MYDISIQRDEYWLRRWEKKKKKKRGRERDPFPRPPCSDSLEHMLRALLFPPPSSFYILLLLFANSPSFSPSLSLSFFFFPLSLLLLLSWNEGVGACAVIAPYVTPRLYHSLTARSRSVQYFPESWCGSHAFGVRVVLAATIHAPFCFVICLLDYSVYWKRNLLSVGCQVLLWPVAFWQATITLFGRFNSSCSFPLSFLIEKHRLGFSLSWKIETEGNGRKSKLTDCVQVLFSLRVLGGGKSLCAGWLPSSCPRRWYQSSLVAPATDAAAAPTAGRWSSSVDRHYPPLATNSRRPYPLNLIFAFTSRFSVHTIFLSSAPRECSGVHIKWKRKSAACHHHLVRTAHVPSRTSTSVRLK